LSGLSRPCGLAPGRSGGAAARRWARGKSRGRGGTDGGVREGPAHNAVCIS